MHRFVSTALLFAFVVLIPAAAGAQAGADAGPTNGVLAVSCALAETGFRRRSDERPFVKKHVAFPVGDFFRPLLAGSREPRSLFSYGRLKFGEGATPDGVGDDIDAGSIAAGAVVGIWRREAAICSGIQISLIGGVFADFNLDAYSHDLLNSDFMVGVQATFRSEAVGARVRAYHQSSHLGGDFVANHPGHADLNYGSQTVDALLSFDRPGWRVYGGAGYVDFMNDGATSWLVQAGGELRGPPVLWWRTRPVAGFDARRLQVYKSGATMTGSAGVEWNSLGTTRTFRIMAIYSSGVVPLGQLTVDQRSRSFRTQFQIEF